MSDDPLKHTPAVELDRDNELSLGAAREIGRLTQENGRLHAELEQVTKERDRYRDALAADQQRLFHYEGTFERLRDERDQLYTHVKALVEMLTTLRFNPIATYAAAYLTQIMPPQQRTDKP